MKLFGTIGCIALFAMILPKIAQSACNANVECPPKLDLQGECYTNKYTGETTCYCFTKDQILKRENILADFIQAKEGVDKSQLVNLDEVVQKAVEESSQKAGTPVKFMVKVQSDDKSLPKEVEYQIQTSK